MKPVFKINGKIVNTFSTKFVKSFNNNIVGLVDHYPPSVVDDKLVLNKDSDVNNNKLILSTDSYVDDGKLIL